MIRICPCLALALCLAFAVPSPVAAEDLERSEFFDEYDRDSDGCVTKEEFTGSSEMFKLLDKDGDGVIKPTDLGLPADFKPDPKRKRRPGGEAGAPGGRKGGDRMQQFLKALQRMDADKDGRVSKAEWKGKEQGFDRMDRNKDGYLDAKDRAGMDRAPGKRGGQGKRGGKGPALPDDVTERIKSRAAEQFGKLDGNADGKITADEVPSPMMLELADANGDGEVTLAEFQKVLLQRATRRAQQQGGGDTRRRGGRGRLNAGTLKRWDRDGDGKVGPDEFPGREAMFARLDADKDGFLTQADIDARKGAGGQKDTAGPLTKKTGTVIERMDTDGDGRLHRGEFAGSAADWSNLDRNRDGWITQDELLAKPN